jgi:putative flippase GtrA
MNPPALLGFQILLGISDTATGALLAMAPGVTLRLLRLAAPADALPFVSFVGAFVLAVGLSYLYGGYLTFRSDSQTKLEVVWLLTALMRASVAIFVVQQILAGTFGMGWVSIAAFDGACVVIQAVGLRRGWLACAA